MAASKTVKNKARAGQKAPKRERAGRKKARASIKRRPSAPARRQRADQSAGPGTEKGPPYLALAEEDEDREPEHTKVEGVRIIGVGASAGGLEAFTALLRGVGKHVGAAIVFVQHLAADRQSRLPELLQAATDFPVIEARSAQHVEPNRVYVIPPRYDLELVDGELRTTPRSFRGVHTPINAFFWSLAETVGERAIGVLLSGTGSDGVEGLRAIKAAGGIAVVQSPDTALYDAMPRAALATGVEDLCLPPGDIGRELSRLVNSPYVRHARPRRAGDALAVDEATLDEILLLLHERQRSDFRGYKKPTLRRRIQRRMVLHATMSAQQYLKLLKTDSSERERLAEDILIHVTRFFREPSSFQALVEHVFPKLLSNVRPDVAIRIWTPGCATGEETYSVAIALHEFWGAKAGGVPIQIFGTDISQASIDRARVGLYSESIAADVSPERLRQFFVKQDRGYRIRQGIRELCVFAKQDLTRDPPFSHVDLILCRNVLIYLSTAVQKRVMSIFHYALKPSGYLMLGEVETVGSFGDLFSVLDKKSRIFARKPVETPRELRFHGVSAPETVQLQDRQAPKSQTNVQGQANRMIIERYGPPGVIVDADFLVVQARGKTGPFLELSSGSASLNILRLARDGLARTLRTTLTAAKTQGAPARREGLRVRHNGKSLTFDLEVIPIERYFLVLFDTRDRAPAARPRATKPSKREGIPRDPAKRRTIELEGELDRTRDQLQAIIQDLESANEELQSANEEILSSNEELQSTNEELDAAREELQSTNEELNTLNDELHGRNEELSRANSDLTNLLASVRIPIVIVSADLKVRHFTPLAQRALNLIPSDVGRPIAHIKPNLEDVNLERLLHGVCDTVQPFEQEVQDSEGSWHMMRIHPYKDLDGRIDGAVLSLFDITKVKQHEREMSAARDFAQAVVQAVHDPLIVLDRKLNVRVANRSFLQGFHIPADGIEGRSLSAISDGDWNIPVLRAALEEMLQKDGEFDGLLLEHSFRALGQRRLRVAARRVQVDDEHAPQILLSIEDVSNSTAQSKTV